MYYWQTMLTGIGAVAAAALSIHFLRRQIESTERQEDGRRKRRLAAARARLPLSLSSTNQYADSALILLRDCLDSLKKHGQVESSITLYGTLPIPEPAILSFEAMVEATDDDLFAALLANMISEIQVLDTRLDDLNDLKGGSGIKNAYSNILYAARIHAYAASIYDYARRESNDAPHGLNWDLVNSALLQNKFYDTAYPDLFEFIANVRRRSEEAGTVTK